MFKFQEFELFELRLSLPPLGIKFVFYKAYNCVFMGKKKALENVLLGHFDILKSK